MKLEAKAIAAAVTTAYMGQWGCKSTPYTCK